jgi:class 3 adenylate cyclase
MALHTGEAVPGPDGNYHGLAVNRTARILAAAHGGQVLCSATAAELLRRQREPEITLSDLGLYRLRGLDEPERLFLIQYEGVKEQHFPRPRPSAPIRAAAAACRCSSTAFSDENEKSRKLNGSSSLPTCA